MVGGQAVRGVSPRALVFSVAELAEVPKVTP